MIRHIELFDYSIKLELDEKHSTYSTKMYKVLDVIGSSRFVRIGNLKDDNVYLSETEEEDDYPFYQIGYFENDKFIVVIEWNANRFQSLIED